MFAFVCVVVSWSFFVVCLLYVVADPDSEFADAARAELNDYYRKLTARSMCLPFLLTLVVYHWALLFVIGYSCVCFELIALFVCDLHRSPAAFR